VKTTNAYHYEQRKQEHSILTLLMHIFSPYYCNNISCCRRMWMAIFKRFD